MKVDVADVMVSVEVLDPLPEVMEGPKCASKLYAYECCSYDSALFFLYLV